MHFTWSISIETLVALAALGYAILRSFSRADDLGEQTRERVKETERQIASNREVTVALGNEIAGMREWMKGYDRRDDQRGEKIDRLTDAVSSMSGSIGQITERLKSIEEKLDGRHFSR